MESANMETKQIFILLMVFILFIIGCKNESTVPLSNLASDSTRYKGIACNKDTVYFFNDIGPLIISSCAMTGCHNTNRGELRALTTYNNIMRYVLPGDPYSSKLYAVLNRNEEDLMPPPPMAAFSSTQKLLVSKWILQGAANNGCIDTNCDTTNVTYSGTVQLIMQTNCTGCHSVTNASGGIKLDKYNDVISTITSGRLYGSIIQSNGFKPMPTGSKLPDCNIKKIKAWINKGYLNN